MDMSSLVFLMIIIGLIVFAGKKLADKANKRDKLSKMYDNVLEIKKYVEEFKKNRKTPTIKTSLILKNDEEAYIEDTVKLYEIRSASKSDRLYIGGRIMKGIFLGGSTGVSRKFDELREIDSGKLALTNKRVIFDGNFNARTIDLEKIISIEIYDDGFEIACEDKKQSQLYGGIRNPFLWKNLITGIVKTKGVENRTLREDEILEIKRAEDELNQMIEELGKKVKKS